MSENSRKLAEAAKENPELLGTTNTGSREKQSPATASKVERSLVQAEALEPTDVVGNTANRPSRSIESEFESDTDATVDRMEALGREVPDVPNPQNRFAPNNVGAEAEAEGQGVDTSGENPVGISTEEAKVRGIEVANNADEAGVFEKPEFSKTVTLGDNTSGRGANKVQTTPKVVEDVRQEQGDGREETNATDDGSESPELDEAKEYEGTEPEVHEGQKDDTVVVFNTGADGTDTSEVDETASSEGVVKNTEADVAAGLKELKPSKEKKEGK